MTEITGEKVATRTSLSSSSSLPIPPSPNAGEGGVQETEGAVGANNIRGGRPKASATKPGPTRKKYGESPMTKKGDHGKLVHTLESVYHMGKEITNLIPEGYGASFFSKASESVINSWTESPAARALLSIAVEQIKEDLASLSSIPPRNAIQETEFPNPQGLRVPLNTHTEAIISPQLPIQAATTTTAVNGDPYEYDVEFQSVVGKAVIFDLMGSVEGGFQL